MYAVPPNDIDILHLAWMKDRLWGTWISMILQDFILARFCRSPRECNREHHCINLCNLSIYVKEFQQFVTPDNERLNPCLRDAILGGSCRSCSCSPLRLLSCLDADQHRLYISRVRGIWSCAITPIPFQLVYCNRTTTNNPTPICSEAVSQGTDP